MMDAHLDALLDDLVAAEPREEWTDVLARTRRSRRRYTAIGAAVAVLVLAPATWAAVNAFEGTPAPISIHQQFERWEQEAMARSHALAAAGFSTYVPQADADQAHGVLQLATSDGPLDMWAAPELGGNGSCWFVGWESDLYGNTPEGAGGCTQGDDPIYVPGTWNDDANHPAYAILAGSVAGSETTVDVTLTNGDTTTLPVVEHLFLAALPRGSQPASIIGRDGNGNVVATWTGPGS